MSMPSRYPAQPQSPYQEAPFANTYYQSPIIPRATNRSLLKYIFLGIITLGIYDLFVMTESTNTVNIAASRYDGRNSLHYLLMVFLVGWATMGIGWLVWFHNLSDRIGNELQRRGYPRLLSASDYWLWNILGSIIIVGPFVYLYKFFKALNILAADYNRRG
ncbi:MAG: DUF4234 domain-containing protein [Bifidobacteriaceae bacterium]|jgi:hypothetical protein|nr:DUF4234 domain-containing protein [Bifidobacteriaceae bacterium]MCI1978228.1 DUF4234 domain-containing protein [Bifidobacteriaceae bacterium]